MSLAIALPSGLLGVLLLAGCAGGEEATLDPARGSSSPSTPPRAAASPSDPAESTAPVDPSHPAVGGPVQDRVALPEQPMDRLEQPIATRLGRQVAGQGLSLDYLDCPHWDGTAPEQLTCTGYLDGVTADVRVELTRSGTRVGFDAELQDGVLATQNLVRSLRSHGYTGVDCGRRAAYRTVVGVELVCSVLDGRGRDALKYVVAEVVDREGGVRIRDY